MVRTLRCGRSNPGSNPGHGSVASSLRKLAGKMTLSRKMGFFFVRVTKRNLVWCFHIIIPDIFLLIKPLSLSEIKY